LLYYPTLNLAFAYDSKIKFLVKIDCETSTVSLLTMALPTMANNNALVKDPSEELLFVNTAENEITAYDSLTEELPSTAFKIQNIGGQCLTDFKTLPKRRLLTLSTDGHLQLYGYSDNTATIISEFNMNYGRMEKLRDTFTSIGVDPFDSKYFVLTTEKKDRSLAKIILVKLNKDFCFTVLSKKIFRLHAESVVYDIGIHREQERPAIVYAYQNNGPRNLIILAIMNERLELVDKFGNFHKNRYGKCEVRDGYMYSVETTGTLRIVKI